METWFLLGNSGSRSSAAMEQIVLTLREKEKKEATAPLVVTCLKLVSAILEVALEVIRFLFLLCSSTEVLVVCLHCYNLFTTTLLYGQSPYATRVNNFNAPKLKWLSNLHV